VFSTFDRVRGSDSALGFGASLGFQAAAEVVLLLNFDWVGLGALDHTHRTSNWHGRCLCNFVR
jgi:hypothetical protein